MYKSKLTGDEVSPEDLQQTAEIQSAIRDGFETHEVKSSVRVMALFSLLVETFGKVDWESDGTSQLKVRLDMRRMAMRLNELSNSRLGQMRMQQVLSADEVGVGRVS